MATVGARVFFPVFGDGLYVCECFLCWLLQKAEEAKHKNNSSLDDALRHLRLKNAAKPALNADQWHNIVIQAGESIQLVFDQLQSFPGLSHLSVSACI